MIDASFVIIEYHSLPDVEKCVSSIINSCENLSIEIIVSSNSQYPVDTQEFLKNNNGKIKWIFNQFNGGFAYGMNSGISVATGEVVVLTNPDARIKSGSILNACKFILSNQEVGIMGPTIVDHLGNLQDSFREFATPINLFIRMIKRIVTKKDVLLSRKYSEITQCEPVDWVIGAFMIVRKDAIDVVGKLDDKYFLYVEDMDWCKRFWSQGYMVYYYPLLIVEYKGDRKSLMNLFSFKKFNKYTYFHVRSYFRFVLKHGFFPSRKSSETRLKSVTFGK